MTPDGGDGREPPSPPWSKLVIPAEQHTAAGKESGFAAHVERWNNTLRQRLGRFVRKSLSFSKSDAFNLGGILEYRANNDIAASIAQFGLMLTYGICMPIAGGIYAFAPGQDHS